MSEADDERRLLRARLMMRLAIAHDAALRVASRRAAIELPGHFAYGGAITGMTADNTPRRASFISPSSRGTPTRGREGRGQGFKP